MDFRVLGPLEVRREGRPLNLGGPKQRALLAIFLLHANETLSSDRLIDLLWDEKPPASASKILHVYVSQLRKVLEADEGGEPAVLVTVPSGYVLRVLPDAFDLHRFEALLASARRSLDDGRPGEAAREFADALALWRGAPLADFAFDSFAQIEIVRLEEMRLAALEGRIEAELLLGRHAALVSELIALLAAHPAREKTAALLMLALYRGGRQAEALDVYRRMRLALTEELGVEPGAELQDLHHKVLAQDDSLRWVPPRAHPTPNNLPAPVTSFVARHGELEVVAGLLDKHRLVTLIGPGGCGKSRLGLEVAIRSLPAMPGGVWLIELAAINDSALVSNVISATLGVREVGGRPPVAAVAEAVGDRRVLLLMDNCEHLIEGSAATAAKLLAACPRLRIIATSREPLSVPGEAPWEVPSLPFPLADEDAMGRFTDYGAVRLFLERARAADPEFDLNDRTAPHVTQICRRLDGMPLALELAASRTRSLSVAEIAARLDDRFRLLTRGMRTALPRHQTLRAAIDWSYALLSDDERALFARLSVFAGSFTLSAAEVVAASTSARPTLELLPLLAEKSLVSVERREGGSRYRLLETIRAYAAEVLEARGEADQVRTRHAAFFLALAEKAAPHLKGDGQRIWLESLNQEHDNLRAALEWFVETGRHEREVRLAAGLWRACYLSGRYAEGRAWLERALDHRDVPVSQRAEALLGGGALAFYQCDYDDAHARCLEALSLYRALDETAGIASALTILGSISRERGDYEGCLALHGEAMTAYRRLGDSWGIAHSLQLSGFASWLRGDFDAAESASREAVAAFRRLGDEERTAWALMDLGAVAHYRGRIEEARRDLDESRLAFEALGFKEGVAWAKNLLALTHLENGDPFAASRDLHESLSVHRELGDRWRVSSVLEALAAAEARRGREELGAILLGCADALRATIGTPVPPCERPLRDLTVAALTASLGSDAFDDAYRRGRATPVEETARMAAAADHRTSGRAVGLRR